MRHTAKSTGFLRWSPGGSVCSLNPPSSCGTDANDYHSHFTDEKTEAETKLLVQGRRGMIIRIQTSQAGSRLGVLKLSLFL